ncbi:hypothetical protein OG730_04950 [Streptomyces sp. NBC_01298]|uniref:hypothetical protein n=1 Tax=Streptomyces sp. NBC_01298 TaxID=2903817 RepID=UPI002E125A42|nr:hypothetical protein OG730_04950 [Streptomyces sp. NBC_01298]
MSTVLRSSAAPQGDRKLHQPERQSTSISSRSLLPRSSAVPKYDRHPDLAGGHPHALALAILGRQKKDDRHQTRTAVAWALKQFRTSAVRKDYRHLRDGQALRKG